MTMINRRRFLQSATALGFAGGAGVLSSLGARGAFAADVRGYKALVCIFLKGGMDHFDFVLPQDTTSFNELKGVRGGIFGSYASDTAASVRNRNNLLTLNAVNSAGFGGRSFGLGPEMAPLHAMFEAGDAALIGSVGPLVVPTTRSEIEAKTVPLPPRLFSHNDQQSAWMSLGLEGARYGWGARFADMALAAAPGDDPRFAAISTGSNDVFLSGETARPFSVPGGGPRRIELYTNNGRLGSGSAQNAARAVVESYFSGTDTGVSNLYMRDYGRGTSSGVEMGDAFRAAGASVPPVTASFPNTGLGKQMKTVAETVAMQQVLGVSRQVFYVSTGGYDTHSNQAGTMPRLLGELADAVAAFKTAMTGMGRWNDVTVFSASDFGRTLNDNGDGTDHGWAGHQFVAGGQVAGKRIYGSMPGYDTASADYTSSRGRLIPTVSVEQYAATLGRWFGLDPGELGVALPGLGNFVTRDLGFMGSGIS